MIKIIYQSGIYQLKSKQVIHAGIEKVWQYFSKPENLNHLTPKDMSFKITCEVDKEMYPGQIISYQIEILPRIVCSWVTEITHVKPKSFFVDEQRCGPYKIWHHEHRFIALNDHKVEMYDIVTYKLPMGLLGRLIAGKSLQKRVRKIFTYRYEKVSEIFST